MATSAGFRAAADVPSAPWTPEGGMHSRGWYALPCTPEGGMHSGMHVEALVRLAGRVQGRGGRVGVVKAPVGCTGEPRWLSCDRQRPISSRTFWRSAPGASSSASSVRVDVCACTHVYESAGSSYYNLGGTAATRVPT